MAICALTTVDNPYSPFTEFNQWFLFDTLNNYNSCQLLARTAFTSDSLSDAENEEEIEFAIDEIVKNDPLKLYKKVTKEDL